MRSDAIDAAALHHDDFVGILNGRDALGDDEFGCVRDFFLESGPDQGIRPGLSHGAGRVIENQDFWLFHQSARDTEPLSLPAGDVCAAFFNISVVAIRKALDEFIGLSLSRRSHQLCIGSGRIAPTQIVFDRSREQDILEHHSDFAAQCLHIIIAYIDAADFYRTTGCIIETRNKIGPEVLALPVPPMMPTVSPDLTEKLTFFKASFCGSLV